MQLGIRHASSRVLLNHEVTGITDAKYIEQFDALRLKVDAYSGVNPLEPHIVNPRLLSSLGPEWYTSADTQVDDFE
jgi:hypothetical protein